MRRVAALYDIHGNLPALEAVLAEVERLDVDALVIGGDVVPGPLAGECVDLLRDFPSTVLAIQGNGEADVLEAARGGGLSRVPEPFRPIVRWAADQLSADQIAWLEDGSDTLTLSVEGLGRVLFCHATPRSDNELFTLRTPDERLEPVLADVEAEVLICGHTHMAFRRRVGELTVVNAGSVGMPFGTAGSFWALLDEGGVELRRTEYDLEAANARIAATGYGLEVDLTKPPSAEQMEDLFESRALEGR